MVDQAKTLRCWWCNSPHNVQFVTKYNLSRGGWFAKEECMSCFNNSLDAGRAIIRRFDTQEERDLWLVKQRL
jgi:aryl-phospho-beta-D-glucosidase BglC (GH1 family)